MVVTMESDIRAAGHPDRAELAAYLDRALLPDDRRRVEAHLADCGECLGELVVVSRLIRSQPRPLRRYWPAGVAAAAVILLVFLLPRNRADERPTTPAYREP